MLSSADQNVRERLGAVMGEVRGCEVKVLHQRVVGMAQVPQGSVHGSEPARAQVASGQHAHALIFGWIWT